MKLIRRKKIEDETVVKFVARFFNRILLYENEEGIDKSQVKYFAKFLPKDVKKTIIRLIDEHGEERAVEEFIPYLKNYIKTINNTDDLSAKKTDLTQ